MKYYVSIIIASLLLIGCNSKEPIPEKKIEITFNYTLSQSGSMTRGDVYDTFYDLFIKSGQLLPSNYSLRITTLDGKEVALISGIWNNNQPVMLATGKYHVTGSSNGAGNDFYRKAVLEFDEDIEITEAMTSVTLHAAYDCFLLLFDAAGKSYFSWSADGRSSDSQTWGDVPKVSDFYYIFAQGFKDTGNVRWN